MISRLDPSGPEQYQVVVKVAVEELVTTQMVPQFPQAHFQMLEKKHLGPPWVAVEET